MSLKYVYHPNIRFLADRSNPGFVRQLKGVFGVAQIMIIRTYHLKQWRYCLFHFQPHFVQYCIGLIRITIRTIVTTKFVTVISVLIPKKSVDTNRNKMK
jgi:hypothetical protein